MLAGIDSGLALEMYKSKIDNETLNNTILKIIQVLEANGDTYVDQFPIAIDPFRFTYDDVEKQIKWKKNNKIDENATPEEIFYTFKDKYEISNNDITEIRKIIAIRYQITQDGYSSTKSIRISDQISITSRDIFNEKGDEFPGVSIVVQPIRTYPKGRLASHILGYTSKIGPDELKEEIKKGNDYNQNDYYGKSGIEKVAEKYLKGQDGIKQIDMAVDGTITDEYIEEEAIQGSDIILTIDSNLQAVTEEALKNNIEQIKNGDFGKNNQSNATGGAMVVMNVNTGEILAMASYPDYEPSKFIFGIDSNTWKEYLAGETGSIKNKAVSENYSPGSIFKMVTAIAGLETGTITTTSKINDTGVYPHWHNPVCWLWTSSHRGHGYLNVSGAIQHSCNFFFYDVGYRMGIDNLVKYTKYFGLGTKTGVELPTEATGQISGPETSKKLNKTWYAGDTLSAVIGQGDNSFTPIQMTKYASMLANGGKNIDVTIIKSIEKADGTQVPKQEYEQYFNEYLGISNEQEDLQINPENLEAVREGMKSVTSESGGTAYSIFRNFNIEVGGKTGSAQAGTDANGNKITHAWFLGFAPFDSPEIAVVVFVENGGHGSLTAYAARDVMQQYFGMNHEGINEDIEATSYVEEQN